MVALVDKVLIVCLNVTSNDFTVEAFEAWLQAAGYMA